MGPLNDGLKDALCEQIAKTIALDVGDKYSGYNCTRRSNKLKVDSHRKGPVPIEECILTKATQVRERTLIRNPGGWVRFLKMHKNFVAPLNFRIIYHAPPKFSRKIS